MRRNFWTKDKGPTLPEHSHSTKLASTRKCQPLYITNLAKNPVQQRGPIHCPQTLYWEDKILENDIIIVIIPCCQITFYITVMFLRVHNQCVQKLVNTYNNEWLSVTHDTNINVCACVSAVSSVTPVSTLTAVLFISTVTLHS